MYTTVNAHIRIENPSRYVHQMYTTTDHQMYTTYKHLDIAPYTFTSSHCPYETVYVSPNPKRSNLKLLTTSERNSTTIVVLHFSYFFFFIFYILNNTLSRPVQFSNVIVVGEVSVSRRQFNLNFEIYAKH